MSGDTEEVPLGEMFESLQERLEAEKRKNARLEEANLAAKEAKERAEQRARRAQNEANSADEARRRALTLRDDEYATTIKALFEVPSQKATRHTFVVACATTAVSVIVSISIGYLSWSSAHSSSQQTEEALQSISTRVERLGHDLASIERIRSQARHVEQLEYRLAAVRASAYLGQKRFRLLIESYKIFLNKLLSGDLGMPVVTPLNDQNIRLYYKLIALNGEGMWCGRGSPLAFLKAAETMTSPGTAAGLLSESWTWDGELAELFNNQAESMVALYRGKNPTYTEAEARSYEANKIPTDLTDYGSLASAGSGQEVIDRAFQNVRCAQLQQRENDAQRRFDLLAPTSGE